MFQPTMAAVVYNRTGSFVALLVFLCNLLLPSAAILPSKWMSRSMKQKIPISSIANKVRLCSTKFWFFFCFHRSQYMYEFMLNFLSSIKFQFSSYHVSVNIRNFVFNFKPTINFFYFAQRWTVWWGSFGNGKYWIILSSLQRLESQSTMIGWWF